MFCKKHYTLIALKMIIKQIIDFFKLKYFVLAIKFFTLTVYDTTKYLFAQYATTDRIFIFFIKKWSKWRIKDIFNSSLKSLAMHWQSICRMFFQYSHLLLIRVYCCESFEFCLRSLYYKPNICDDLINIAWKRWINISFHQMKHWSIFLFLTRVHQGEQSKVASIEYETLCLIYFLNLFPYISFLDVK